MKKTFTLISVLLVLMVSMTACTRQQLGTGIGAGAGAGVGSAVGGTTGAVIGGVGGALVGHEVTK